MLVSSHSAVALRVGIFGGFAIRSVGVVTPALSVPLKTGVLVSLGFALVEALLLFALVEELSASRAVCQVTCGTFLVDVAS